MKKRSYKVFFLLLSVCWILNNSFSGTDHKSFNLQIHFVDTIIRKGTILDTSLYSGYLENLQSIRGLVLNSKRIDSLLKNPLPKHYVLSAEDRKRYRVSIDQKDIKKPGDTLVFGKKRLVVYLPLRLTNQSADTLKYVIMDCSWLDNYFTNNKAVRFGNQICYKNGVLVKKILPWHAESTYIPVLLDKESTHKKIKIGMSLQKFVGGIFDLNYDPFVLMLKPETINLIWSNEIELP